MQQDQQRVVAHPAYSIYLEGTSYNNLSFINSISDYQSGIGLFNGGSLSSSNNNFYNINISGGIAGIDDSTTANNKFYNIWINLEWIKPSFLWPYL
jgi:hypothetical protein